MRTPRLFVEAKALGQDLNDRKWANQIMGYAAVAGVQWVVITNGDEYRIYNSCARVPIEEKLFRKVAIADEQSPVVETLALLSKERIRENEIEIRWNAHFVDRQIRVVLETLFALDPNPALVKLVRKWTTELSIKEVRASLRRLQVQFDFPVEPTDAPAPPPRDKGKRPTVKRPPKSSKVSLRDLIRAGLLKPPVKLTRCYKGHDVEAELLPDGRVRVGDETYESCSMAAIVARIPILGRRSPMNGWWFWQYRDKNGEIVSLEVARKEFLKRKPTERS